MKQTITDTTKPKLYDKILFTEKEITNRIDVIADILIDRFSGRSPLFVCLLRGGAPFSTKLMFAIAQTDPYFHPELDYMIVRTYGSVLTAKKPEIVMDLGPKTEIKGRPVVILDDILDTGATADYIASQLRKRGAAEVDLCVLIRKNKEQPIFEGEIFHGFETLPDWQTGMGLDDPRISKEANRWTNYVALALSEAPNKIKK